MANPIPAGVGVPEHRVALGIALYGYVPSMVYYRHIKWFAESVTQTRELIGLHVSENCYLPWARRDIVREVLAERLRVQYPDGSVFEVPRYTHIFFLDQDVIVPLGTIRRLLEHGRPIVGALYYQKVQGHAPVAGFFDNTEPGTLDENGVINLGWKPLEQVRSAAQRVEVLGLGATLIDLAVFRRLGDDMAWFDMNARTGEDLEFCKRAAAAGFKIWVDPTIDTQHVGATPVTGAYRGVGVTPSAARAAAEARG